MSTKIAAGRLEGAHQRRSTSVGKPPPSAGSAFPLPTPSDLVTAEPGDMHESEMQQQAPSALAMATHALEEVAAGGANAAAQLAQQQQQQQQQQAPGGTQPHRTKFHALSFHHSHFAKAQDRDTSSLTAIKHAILPPPLLPDQVITPAQIDAVRARHPHVCEKVATRTVQMIVTRNAKNVATEKTRRLGLVMVTGFNASTREPYRPLGAPVLQVEDLVSGALSVPVKRQGIDSKSGRECVFVLPSSESSIVLISKD
ncbi:hypothetical protein BC828DRAFT_411 [Blastocladiella britannica]|nr:hypothetical protein BC828DRAFT_411 [Blastocladiella britannica]